MTQIKDIAITKTVANDGDFLIMQNPASLETYKITKANLLAGLSSSGSSSGSTTLSPYVVFAAHLSGDNNSTFFVSTVIGFLGEDAE